MVVLVLGFEVLMNNIFIDEEDTLSSFFGYFDVINYEKTVGSLLEIILYKRPDAELGGDQDVVHESDD